MAVALVVLALIAAASRRSADYDSATPEGSAQGYLEAVFDGDERAARAYLAPALGDRCRTGFGGMWAPEGARAILDEVFLDGDTAQVDVTISVAGPPSLLPDPGERFDITLVMTRAGEGWEISEIPWPLYGCDWRHAP